MKTKYHQLKEEFEKNVKELQKNCNHPANRLVIYGDNSMIEKWNIYPRIDAICGICNVKWVIFQNVWMLDSRKKIRKIWEEMTKIGANRCDIDDNKKTHFTFLDNGILQKLTKEKSDEWRLPYKRNK